jgi:PhnB protein
MKNLIPYLIINDKCEEALNFYKDCFGGQITLLQKYSDIDGYQVSADFKAKVAHAEFRADNIHFYASDGFDGQTETIGSNIALSVNFDNQNEQRQAFDKLKIGGTVTLDFSETSVSSTLVTLIDKYGIHWYLNYEHTK